VPAEHVEVPGAAVVGDQVHPRLEHDRALAVRPDRVLHRGDDIRRGDAKAVNVRAGQEPERQLRPRPARGLVAQLFVTQLFVTLVRKMWPTAVG
jgi:hypothetical protein